MAVESQSIKTFEDWYTAKQVDPFEDVYNRITVSPAGDAMWNKFEKYKREMNSRVANYHKLLKLADAEVISPKPDLANVSSGETSGMILRMARNLVQNTPNVEVTSIFDDDSSKGIFVDYVLKYKVIGDDQYSNDMQQNLFASTKNALTLGFDCVVAVLQVDANGAFHVKYDNVYYRDVFPEPGAKDIRQANDVFIRRYLTSGDLKRLIDTQPKGWDIAALRTLSKTRPRPKDRSSVDHETSKHRMHPEGYEVITWYSSTGEHFLTFDAHNKLLLRIEKNKHPLKWHPVFFLVLEKDLNQPLGKSQVERIIGRQEFQDLMLNGAMKLWYRNINPAIIGYGTTNGTLNLSPGKFNQLPNPNSRIEAFEVNSQTLLQFNSISQANAGNMIQQIGAADQQMASQNTGGMMSQTPQGVEAQREMVDITTNNYQKAIESFFSKYCSYALTLYFHELSGVSEVVLPADSRQKLLAMNYPPENIDAETATVKISFKELATEYFVRTVPGSLVEMEDEKQLRILNELFIPLSQAMPALANAGDQAALQKASAAMQYIIEKQLELSGSKHAKELKELMANGPSDALLQSQQAITTLEDSIGQIDIARSSEADRMAQLLQAQQEQITLLREGLMTLTERLGVPNTSSASEEPAITTA